jgi:hypothetical protein
MDVHVEREMDHVADLHFTVSHRQPKLIALNLSLFVEDQNDPGIGQTLPFSLCLPPWGLTPLVRSIPPARTHSAAARSARIERSPRILGGWFC